MDDWRPAKALDTLLEQLDADHPDRPRPDGIIGDPAHAARVSDHNPNAAGVVTAADITTADFTDELAETFRGMGRAGDGRVKYVIYKHRIASSTRDWAWRAYDGDPHVDHIHLSVSAKASQYDRTDPWPLAGPEMEDDDMTPTQAKQLREVRKIAATTDGRVDRLDEKVDALDAKLDQILARTGKGSE